MNNLFSKMLAHPLATMIVVGALGSAVKEIIETARSTSK